MEEISAAVRDVSGDDFRSISYEAQQLLKSVRASNGYSDGADAAFYRAYFEGFSGKTRSDSKILSNAALEAAYQMGADAKNDVGTFHTVGNATISKEATAFLAKAAKDLGLSITYGGKGSVSNGGVVNGAVRRGVRRGYANSYRGIHIYEDAKVQEVGGKTLVGGDAAARIILGHELTHILQKQSPTQYKAFEAFALRQRSEQGSKIGLDLVSEYMRDLRLDKQSATDEVVANYFIRGIAVRIVPELTFVKDRKFRTVRCMIYGKQRAVFVRDKAAREEFLLRFAQRIAFAVHVRHCNRILDFAERGRSALNRKNLRFVFDHHGISVAFVIVKDKAIESLPLQRFYFLRNIVSGRFVHHIVSCNIKRFFRFYMYFANASVRRVNIGFVCGKENQAVCTFFTNRRPINDSNIQILLDTGIVQQNISC